MPPSRLVLLLGCTGPLGFHIANKLLLNPTLAVRVVVRSKTKLQKLFKEREIAFESIIQGDLSQQPIITQAFIAGKFGPVTDVVSCLGAKERQTGDIEKVEHVTQVKLIQEAKLHKIKRFLLVTSAMMERPYSFIAFMLNTFVTDVLYWKAKAENHLRRSELDYVIVRPPRLIGQFDELPADGLSYKLLQGDTVKGRIHRHSAAQAIHDCLLHSPANCTLECEGGEGGLKMEELKMDTEEKFVRVNPDKFKQGKNIYKAVELLIILTIAWYLLC